MVTKNGWLHCLLGCFLPCIPIYYQRKRARAKYGVKGSDGTDALCASCCGNLVAIQTAAEIKNDKYPEIPGLYDKW